MSRCRARSFYVAPGDRRYFDACTLATRGSDGAWVEFTHRSDIARYAAEHPGWDGGCWLGPAGGLEVLANAVARKPREVQLWHLDARVVEGRRPADAAGFALHRATVAGVGRAGGPRQVAVDAFPGAGRGVLAAAEGAVRRGALSSVWVCSTAWRAGLVRSEAVVRLLADESGGPPGRVLWQGLTPELLSGALEGLAEADVEVVLGELADPFSGSAAVSGLLRLASDPAVIRRAHDRVRDDDSYEADWVATRNPNCPPELLAELHARCGDLALERQILSNPNCPVDLLTAAVRGGRGGWILESVARNPNCTPELLAELAWMYPGGGRPPQIDRSVARGLAANRSSPASVFEALVAGGHLSEASLSANCPPEILEELADQFAGFAAVNPFRSGDWQSAVDADVAQRDLGRLEALVPIVRDPRCPVEMLERAVRSGSVALTGAVVSNPSTPGDLLVTAAWGSANSGVSVGDRLRTQTQSQAAALLGHPNCPLEVVEAAIRLENYWGPALAVTSPNCPLEVVVEQLSAGVHLTVCGASGVRRLLDRLLDEGEVTLAAQVAATVMHGDAVAEVASRRPELVMSAKWPMRSLHDAAVVRSTGVEFPSRVRRVADLPSALDLPFGFRDTSDERSAVVLDIERVSAVCEGREVVMRVFDTPREVSENATYMGNCIEGYVPAVEDGATLLAEAVDRSTGETLYNVELRRRSAADWSVGEVNSRFNAGGAEAAPLVAALAAAGFGSGSAS